MKLLHFAAALVSLASLSQSREAGPCTNGIKVLRSVRCTGSGWKTAIA